MSKLMRHWDQANKDGHIMEDFFHIVDCQEADLLSTDKMSHYDFFMRLPRKKERKFNYNDPSLWLDYFLIGFYRNIRKRYLYTTRYTERNEELFLYHGISRAKYEEKQKEYQQKIRHYGSMALKYLSHGSSFFSVKGRSGRLKRNENILLDVIKRKAMGFDQTKHQAQIIETFDKLYKITKKVTKIPL